MVQPNRATPGFDADWYLSTYVDVAAAGIDPLDHFLKSGRDEGRLPGPTWDDPADLITHPASAQRSPTVDMTEAAAVPGLRTSANGVRVLLVGHAAGTELFGAERNFLELLDGYVTLGYDVVATVPTQVNETYIDEIRKRCLTVHIMPVPPRRPREAPNDELIDRWCQLIDRHAIQVVHVNTIMPREPVLAARRRGIPAVVHAHEIPQGDNALCAVMGADHSEIIANVTAEATYIIGNSSVTTRAYDMPARTAVVPNIVDLADFPVRATKRGRPTVALIGDPAPRKGVRDFARLATMLRDRVDAQFVIVGPAATANYWLTEMDLPDNLAFAGYSRRPSEAIAQADIVVNLSRCRETFARTVLEGMAAGLPIVAYNRGALPLLVDHRRTGILVPFDDADALADAVERLCRDTELRSQMGAAGRAVAAARFSAKNLARALSDTYAALLPSEDVRRQQANDIVVEIPTVNRSEYRDPFFAGYRSRWAYTTGVTFVDSTTVVCDTLLGCLLYTIKFDPDSRAARIVGETPTRDLNNDSLSSELIDCDGKGRLITSNGTCSSVSLYEYDGEQVHWTSSLDLDDPDTGFCHGARFVPGRDDIVAACVTTGTRGVRFISATNGEVQWSIEFDGRAPKDITFKGRDRMAVTLHAELTETHPLEGLEGAIALLDIDLDNGTHRIIDEYPLPDSILDGLCVYGDRLYAISQNDDRIMVFDTSNDRLRRLADMRGFSFPHQVAVSPDGRWIAVACYGDGAVVLRPVTE